LSFDLQPGASGREKVERRLGLRGDPKAPRRAHVGQAVDGAGHGQPQQQLAQPVGILKLAQTAHHMSSCSGTFRPTIHRKNQVPESPMKANCLWISFLVVSKSPSESRYRLKPLYSVSSSIMRRALEAIASSFLRLRMTRVSPIRRSMSLVLILATRD